MWQPNTLLQPPRKSPLFSYMADDMAQTPQGDGMGSKKGQVTSAAKREECHKLIIMKKFAAGTFKCLHGIPRRAKGGPLHYF
jgi:hypothetical protein